MKLLNANTVEMTHFCLFAGAGGLSLGLNRGHARVGSVRAKMRCLGGVDAWPLAVANFSKFTGTPGTKLDLFSRADYVLFHGKEPPKDWREATAADVRAAAGNECPDILATSPPCKGFSGLLSGADADKPKYQALNRLVIHGLELALESFSDDPPSLILLENVPRIQQRGRQLLDDVKALLQFHDYAVAETTHDCGELGGLSQHRKRFLLVARHAKKVKNFLYEPPKRPVQSIGHALQNLPMPENPAAGPMHRLPRLQWLTWLRLALIEAGKDWRSLEQFAVVDGYLRDVGIVPLAADWHAGCMGVGQWRDPTGTVKGRSGCTNGTSAVADPRWPANAFGSFTPYAIVPWAKPAATVTGQAAPGSGPFSVADPRIVNGYGSHNGKIKPQLWTEPSATVTGSDRVGSGARCIADPRGLTLGRYGGKFQIQKWQNPSRTVTCDTDVQTGAQCIADPRPTWNRKSGDAWAGGGHFGVLDRNDPAGTVSAHARHDNGFWSVADWRLPNPTDRPDPVPLIVSLDQSWHRPLTTWELAHLQGYPLYDADGKPWQWEKCSDQQQRELIGNSVPPPAAEAIGSAMAEALLLQFLGHSFALSTADIWVQPFLTALSVAPNPS